MKHILLIDDDPDILDAIHILLEQKGYRVVASDRGDHAENLIEDCTDLPNLIILDVLLSGKDGRLIARQLKECKKTKHIPIIMLSAHPTVEKSVQSLGIEAFLAKPFDVDDLLILVKKHLQ